MNEGLTPAGKFVMFVAGTAWIPLLIAFFMRADNALINVLLGVWVVAGILAFVLRRR